MLALVKLLQQICTCKQ